jgi:hypothetical protein
MVNGGNRGRSNKHKAHVRNKNRQRRKNAEEKIPSTPENEMDKELAEELSELQQPVKEEPVKEEPVKEEPVMRPIEEVAMNMVNKMYPEVTDKQLKQAIKQMNSNPQMLNLMNMLRQDT